MNRILLIFFALLISCKSPSQNGKISATNLTELKVSFSTKNEKEFLKNFPKDFSSFKSTFGWNDKKDSANPLYKEANYYIDYWFFLINKSIYKNYESQIISICKNGKWEADAVNYFKSNATNYIEKNKKYNLINDLSSKDAQSVLSFLLMHSENNFSFISNLNLDKQKIANSILSKNISSEKKRSSFAIYENNNNYFIKTFDVNKDGILDKIVSSKAYQGEDLFVFLGSQKGDYNLVLETTNFSEDGGNIIQDVLPIIGNSGIEVKTYFPDRGFYEKEYYLIFENNSWTLRNIIYKTMSDVSEDAVKYICDVPQNIDITKSGWTDKINPIPKENERSKKCRVESTHNTKTQFFIQDTDGYTNLRKDKTATSEVLQKIKSGEFIEVINNSGDWFLVKTREGKTGYVHKSRIESE